MHNLIGVNVDQFYGIEIEEFPAQIAQVALWLVDHQMNLRVSEEFGKYFARIPLVASPHIRQLYLEKTDSLQPHTSQSLKSHLKKDCLFPWGLSTAKSSQATKFK